MEQYFCENCGIDAPGPVCEICGYPALDRGIIEAASDDDSADDLDDEGEDEAGSLPRSRSGKRLFKKFDDLDDDDLDLIDSFEMESFGLEDENLAATV